MHIERRPRRKGKHARRRKLAMSPIASQVTTHFETPEQIQERLYGTPAGKAGA
jgi:hypothetical protein